jgi:hypothetical protein
VTYVLFRSLLFCTLALCFAASAQFEISKINHHDAHHHRFNYRVLRTVHNRTVPIGVFFRSHIIRPLKDQSISLLPTKSTATRTMSEGDDKTSWPELVGKEGSEAKGLVEKEGIKTVDVIPERSMVTMDYRTDRVRIFVDKEGKVTAAPRVG